MPQERRRPWFEGEGESPVLGEVIQVQRVGLAGLETQRLEIPLMMRAAHLMYRGVATNKPYALIKSLFDCLFDKDDATWIAGEHQRAAASALLGHADATLGMPFKARRARVADDFYHQAPDTFRHPDRNGGEPPLLRQIAASVEAIIAKLETPSIVASPIEVDPTLISRYDYHSRIYDHIRSRRLFICIWGEAGTGKTVLADQVAQELGFVPILKLRAGDPDVLRDDIIDALISEGMQPTNWSESYCRAMLRRRLSCEPEKSRCHVVIIDNVDDEGLIWQLIPKTKTPKVLVLITMRHQPESPDLAGIELDDFTEDQACTFIRNHLDGSDELETVALARVLGYRPLALEHAVRFIRESPDVTLRDLINTLAKSVTDGLGLVAPLVDKTKNLVNLYKIILDSVVADATARPALDSFLAVAGKGGMTTCELLYFFMHSDVGGSCDRIHFRSGLRMLTHLGLWRENEKLLVMHPLTYEIFRDLRGAVPLQVEGEYLKFLVSNEVADVRSNNKGLGGTYASVINLELEAMKDVLPDGWRLIHCVDRSTWVAIRVSPAESGVNHEYIVRYEIHPHVLYKLDYRTGERVVPAPEEASELCHVAHAYYERVLPILIDLQRRAGDEEKSD